MVVNLRCQRGGNPGPAASKPPPHTYSSFHSRLITPFGPPLHPRHQARLYRCVVGRVASWRSLPLNGCALRATPIAAIAAATHTSAPIRPSDPRRRQNEARPVAGAGRRRRRRVPSRRRGPELHPALPALRDRRLRAQHRQHDHDLPLDQARAWGCMGRGAHPSYRRRMSRTTSPRQPHIQNVLHATPLPRFASPFRLPLPHSAPLQAHQRLYHQPERPGADQVPRPEWQVGAGAGAGCRRQVQLERAPGEQRQEGWLVGVRAGTVLL